MHKITCARRREAPLLFASRFCWRLFPGPRDLDESSCRDQSAKPETDNPGLPICARLAAAIRSFFSFSAAFGGFWLVDGRHIVRHGIKVIVVQSVFFFSEARFFFPQCSFACFPGRGPVRSLSQTHRVPVAALLTASPWIDSL